VDRLLNIVLFQTNLSQNSLFNDSASAAAVIKRRMKCEDGYE